MLKELVEYLLRTGADKAHPVELDVADPDNKVYFVGADADLVRVARGIPPRDHKADSLAEIVRLATKFVDADGTSVVWYGNEKVVLVTDNLGFRKNIVTLELLSSELFATVCGLWVTKKWMDQKAFIRLLRVELAGALPDPVLIDRIRRVRIENGVVTDSEVSKGKESIGKSIRAEIASGSGEIPDVVTLNIPVYSTMGEEGRHLLSCAVEIDPMQGMNAFRLMPLPDEIARVRKLAMASIAGRLNEELPASVPCYAGKP